MHLVFCVCVWCVCVVFFYACVCGVYTMHLLSICTVCTLFFDDTSSFKESCHVWVGRATNKCGMSLRRVNVTCHIVSPHDDTSSSKSHVIHEWVAVRVNVTCHIYSQRDDMSPFNESCHTWVGRDTFKCDMSNIYVVNEMRHVIIQWVMSYMSDSCYVQTWHVTQWVHQMTSFNESCHTWVGRDTCKFDT